MRIAIAGLASSHPFTDARLLSRREDAELVVFDDEPQRLARFREQHPAARVASDLDGLLAAAPDGVVLTVPTPSIAPALQRFLEHDLPVFVNKPAAATAAQLQAIDTVARKAPHRVLSTSVLRFAPALKTLDVKAEDVIAAHVTIRHDVGLWARGHNPWQDDPAVGGGMLVTMGVHGVELLISRFGPDVELAAAVTAKRHYPQLVSEDSAVLALRWADGLPATVAFVGASQTESYELILHTAAGEHRVTLEGGAEPEAALGYRGTLNAFLAMVGGAPSPVPWEETHAVLSILVAARRPG